MGSPSVTLPFLIVTVLFCVVSIWWTHRLSAGSLQSDCQKSVIVAAAAEEDSEAYASPPEILPLNYKAMENEFKVYVYPIGKDWKRDQTRKLTGKYGAERFFFRNMRESRFRTENPEEADMFFIPISYHQLKGRSKGISFDEMTFVIRMYMKSLIFTYPYWNRTHGADHFLILCRDGISAKERLPVILRNCIQVVCSPSHDDGFIPHRDVALPEVQHPFAIRSTTMNDIEHRTILVSWEDHTNSTIGPKNETEVHISEKVISLATTPPGDNKKEYLRSKFCMCRSQPQDTGTRIADAIHFGCIPVILGSYFDLPFNDIVDWREFAVVPKYSNVSEVRQILENIPDSKYIALHKNLMKVQSHFKWNTPPVSYDAFHMLMYQLWLRRHVVRHEL